MRSPVRWFLVMAVLLAAGTAPARAATSILEPGEDTDLAALGWEWPVQQFRLVRGFVAPAHAYGPGHRGIDLSPASARVLAPADGIVAFAGSVAGRGIVTIDHGSGLVTTLEPVTPVVTAGTLVRRGDEVAALAAGGHAEAGAVHFGVRRHGDYINPQLLLGGVPRAVLLPCC
ncbi:murein hydrolase activator EnvC family protein [Microbacterium sp. P04]|uniref:murein hydrolase activator EnvC family protein n=1 Tax=Microbacterium sp. P04 TaxID=3366947 RepID=UPI003747534E